MKKILTTMCICLLLLVGVFGCQKDLADTKEVKAEFIGFSDDRFAEFKVDDESVVYRIKDDIKKEFVKEVEEGDAVKLTLKEAEVKGENEEVVKFVEIEEKELQ